MCICGIVRYCGVDCQRDHWLAHKQDCQTVVDGKGMGLVATRRIAVGKVIIVESPIITHLGWTENFQQFVDKFQELTVEQKMMYISLLHDPEDNNKVVNKEMIDKVKDFEEEALAIYKVWRILWANSVYIGKKNGLKEKGIYLKISHINHSCKSNVVFGLVEGGENKMSITTCRVINKNQEILLNYIGAESIFNAKKERQAELEENWHFTCKCDVCSLTGEQLDQNDQVRNMIQSFTEKIRSLSQPTLEITEQALAFGMEKLELMENIMEEVLAAFPVALMDCYGQARIIKYLGGQVKVEPESFRERADDVCSMLGPSTRKICREVEEETDMIINIISQMKENSKNDDEQDPH